MRSARSTTWTTAKPSLSAVVTSPVMGRTRTCHRRSPGTAPAATVNVSRVSVFNVTVRRSISLPSASLKIISLDFPFAAPLAMITASRVNSCPGNAVGLIGSSRTATFSAGAVVPTASANSGICAALRAASGATAPRSPPSLANTTATGADSTSRARSS